MLDNKFLSAYNQTWGAWYFKNATITNWQQPGGRLPSLKQRRFPLCLIQTQRQKQRHTTGSVPTSTHATHTHLFCSYHLIKRIQSGFPISTHRHQDTSLILNSYLLILLRFVRLKISIYFCLFKLPLPSGPFHLTLGSFPCRQYFMKTPIQSKAGVAFSDHFFV